MAKNDFQYGGWNSYTLQCGMWLWNHDSELARWQHPVGSRTWAFQRRSAILDLYAKIQKRDFLKKN